MLVLTFKELNTNILKQAIHLLELLIETLKLKYITALVVVTLFLLIVYKNSY
jgi:hypothetical protein